MIWTFNWFVLTYCTWSQIFVEKFKVFSFSWLQRNQSKIFLGRQMKLIQMTNSDSPNILNAQFIFSSENQFHIDHKVATLHENLCWYCFACNKLKLLYACVGFSKENSEKYRILWTVSCAKYTWANMQGCAMRLQLKYAHKQRTHTHLHTSTGSVCFDVANMVTMRIVTVHVCAGNSTFQCCTRAKNYVH